MASLYDKQVIKFWHTLIFLGYVILGLYLLIEGLKGAKMENITKEEKEKYKRMIYWGIGTLSTPIVLIVLFYFDDKSGFLKYRNKVHHKRKMNPYKKQRPYILLDNNNILRNHTFV